MCQGASAPRQRVLLDVLQVPRLRFVACLVLPPASTRLTPAQVPTITAPAAPTTARGHVLHSVKGFFVVYPRSHSPCLTKHIFYRFGPAASMITPIAAASASPQKDQSLRLVLSPTAALRLACTACTAMSGHELPYVRFGILSDPARLRGPTWTVCCRFLVPPKRSQYFFLPSLLTPWPRVWTWAGPG